MLREDLRTCEEGNKVYIIMTVAYYITAKKGLEAILDTFTPESALYKQAHDLLDALIASQIPF